MRIRVNGEFSPLAAEAGFRFADVIELIKASIDPEHMITSVLVDDRELNDDEWMGTISHIRGDVLEIVTGEPVGYVTDRIQDASKVVRSCFLEFRDARKGFQDGDMQNGNRQLKVAVDTLKAFFEWYGTLLQLVPDSRRERLDISTQVIEITDTCKKICQQQLYQSWWALGESIERDLEPKLDKLEDACRRVAKDAQAGGLLA